ncbi:MAG: DUF3006 domain-containing protein [Firmicutes bacterium]|nr:DUF3006 domain-containing protein [Bacillota bacterium]
MKWKAVVDRFEGDYAVLFYVSDSEDENIKIEIPHKLLPKGVKEGDYLTVCWEIDHKSTEAARKRVTTILDRLVNRTENKPHD